MNFFQLRFKALLVFIKAQTVIFGIREFPPILSVSAVIKKDNKLLVIKPTYKKHLLLPGGVVQELETPEEALVREVKEETGLDIKVGKLLGTYTFKKILAGLNFCYQAAITGGKLRQSKEGEPVWLKPEEALRKSGSGTRRKIEEYGT